ncbi:MAG: hypothetical protein O3A19_07230 [Planctomycetota bacterium]|nr:hypothetical protein [Planctomycetota bacterium]MDA1026207.1 hypothetical protein [Planctomycetota bacterium]
MSRRQSVDGGTPPDRGGGTTSAFRQNKSGSFNVLVEVAKLVEDARVEIEAEAWIADRPDRTDRSIIASSPGAQY